MGQRLWKLVNSLSGEYRRFGRYIDQYTSLSLEKARQESNRQLHAYLIYCREYSRYWRERWPRDAEKFSIDEAPHVLKLLPILDKETLRNHLDDLRIDPASRRPGDGFPPIGRTITVSSGGSTGVPSKVVIDAPYGVRCRATWDFMCRQMGWEPGEPVFFIWGSPNELRDMRLSWRKRLSSWLRGLHPMPAFGLTDVKIRAIREEIARKPHVQSALCFATTIETIVEYAEREGLTFRRLRRVISGGGMMHERLRRLITKHLADEVFDIYGGRDIGIVADETRAHDGLAVVSWLTHVEVLDEQGTHVPEGGVGQVHLTHVQNFASAMIRMATGDTARWHEGPGRNPLPTPRLTNLSGRITEHLLLPGGMVIDPSAVIHLIGVIIAPPWVRKFQLVQHAATEFQLSVVAWEPQLPQEKLMELETRFTMELANLAGMPVQVRVVQVDDIPPAASGKHQYCVRRLGQPELQAS